MAAITICSDFGAPKNKIWLFPLFPHLFPMKWWDRMPWSSFSECWALHQLFHSLLSLSSFKKARKFQKNIYFCFIDYAKAFDCVDHNKLWEILQEMGIPDHLICLLRNLYVGQDATVRTGHGTTDWFPIGKGVHQGCILSPCLFNFYAAYIMRKAGLKEA